MSLLGNLGIGSVNLKSAVGGDGFITNPNLGKGDLGLEEPKDSQVKLPDINRPKHGTILYGNTMRTQI